MPRDYVRNSSRSSRNASEGGAWRWVLAAILIVLFAAGIFYLKKQSSKLAAEQGSSSSGGMVQQTLKKKDREQLLEEKSTHKTKTAPAKKAQPISTPQPKFDFYTMLPNQKVAREPRAVTTPTPKKAPVEAKSAKTALSSAANAKVKAPTATSQTNKDSSDDLIALEAAKLGAFKPEKTEAAKKSLASYLLQLGIFKSYTDADKLKAQLVLLGYEIKVKPVKKGEATFYRVWMGPYANLAEVKKQEQELQTKQIKSRIVKL